VLEGHLPIVKELLAQRAQTDIRDKAGYPALAFASEQDDLEIVQALIDAGASPDHAAAHGETPLMVAAAAGQIGVANLLISRKANVLARDSQKKTALMHAASAGHLKVVELLADRATVNELDAFGMGALSCAVAADDIDMCRLLVRTGAQPSPVDGVPALITAVAAKKRAAMLWLLELPASDVNARRSGAGDTALTVAAREGTADLVDLLLEQPAIDVNATGHYGRTALWEAVAGGYEDLVMRLLAVGADAGIADAQGMTPMTLASRRGNSRIVDALDLALQH
jgi:ankyrin repeat protein